MDTPLIGLMGRARSGKDTFAAFLIEDLGFQRFAFADPLKRAALALDPIVNFDEPVGSCGSFGCCEPEKVRLSAIVGEIGWEAAKEIAEVRRTLQRLGVAMRDHVGADVWVRATMDAAVDAANDVRPVVITDVRFPNEAEAVKAAGGILVRLERPGAGAVGETALHVSETALDGFPADRVVVNDGSLEDLRTKAAMVACLV